MAKKKAVCVGIDDYDNPRNNLDSCVADATAMARLLSEEYGFSEVKSLHDAAATVSNVSEHLAWLFDGAQSEDRLVFYFSGHGYQRPGGDVLEEVLVLRDDFFPDDRLSELSQSLPQGVLTVLLDSCFSGGMEKLVMFGEEGVQIGRAKRWIPVDSDELEKEQEVLVAPARFKPKRFAGGTQPPAPAVLKNGAVAGAGKALIEAPVSDEVGQRQLNGLVLSACLENETASAKTAQTDGLSAFTFGLTRSLAELGSSVATRDLTAAVQKRLAAMGFRQTPLLKAPPNGNQGAQAFILLQSLAPAASATPAAPAAPSMVPGLGHLIETIQNIFKQGTTMSDTNNEKVLGSLIGMIASNLPQYLPTILDALRKDYQPPSAAAAAPALTAEQKGFLDIIKIVAQHAPDVIPVVLGAFKGYQPAAAAAPALTAEQKGFFDIIKIVAQHAPDVIPVVLGAFKDYQPVAAVSPAANGEQKGLADLLRQLPRLPSPFFPTPPILPDLLSQLSKDFQPAQGNEKFLGVLIGALASVVPQVLPTVINALQKGNPAFSNVAVN